MRLLIFSVLVGTALSCRSIGAPELKGDIYVLRSVAGQTLPAPDSENPNSTVRLVAESLAFAAADVGERRASYDDTRGGRWTIRTPFTFVRLGNRVEIALQCDDNASCIAPPHYLGSITADELLVDQSNVSPVPRRFELVARR
jgi:hypothetical protein